MTAVPCAPAIVFTTPFPSTVATFLFELLNLTTSVQSSEDNFAMR